MKMMMATMVIVGTRPLVLNRFRTGRQCCCRECNERVRRMVQWASKKYPPPPSGPCPMPWQEVKS